MHLLSERNRSEFLAVPELVRITYVQGQHGFEPTLLIKSSTLALKYLLRQKLFRLVVFRLDQNWVAYGIRIEDDPDSPALLWSLLENDDELDGIRALAKDPKCTVFLFNELALNVAWADAIIDFSLGSIPKLMDEVMLHPSTELSAMHAVHDLSNALHTGKLTFEQGYMSDPIRISSWHPIKSHYVTNRISTSLISMFETDEGRQQEEAALWLIDNLHPKGAVRSPQILDGKNTRELSDLLLSHEFGAFLIESKTLAILARDDLPDRKKLGRNVVKHLDKATRQLVGGVKNLRRGHRITDLNGVEVDVERNQPPHVIALVPDLSLLHDATDLGGEFIRKISAEAGGFFHILDPSELLRMVQAAEMISKRGQTTTPIMAFDAYLMERAKWAITSDTPNFGMLLRFG